MNVGEEMEWKGRDMSELLNVASTPLAGVASGVTDPMIDKFTPPPDIGLAETVLKSEVVVAHRGCR